LKSLLAAYRGGPDRPCTALSRSAKKASAPIGGSVARDSHAVAVTTVGE
jgi:hypothetical protein